MLVHHRCRHLPYPSLSTSSHYLHARIHADTHFFHDHHMSTSPSHIPIILNPFNRSTSLRILLLAHLVSHLLLHPTHHSSIQLISPSPRSATSTPSPSPVLCRLPTPTSATVAAAAAPQVPMPRVTPLGDRVSPRKVWAATRFSTSAAIFHTHLLWSRRKCSKPLFFSSSSLFASQNGVLGWGMLWWWKSRVAFGSTSMFG